MADEAIAEFSAETPILTIRDKDKKKGVAGLDENGQLNTNVLPDEVEFAIVNAFKHTFETTTCL